MVLLATRAAEGYAHSGYGIGDESDILEIDVDMFTCCTFQERQAFYLLRSLKTHQKWDFDEGGTPVQTCTMVAYCSYDLSEDSS